MSGFPVARGLPTEPFWLFALKGFGLLFAVFAVWGGLAWVIALLITAWVPDFKWAFLFGAMVVGSIALMVAQMFLSWLQSGPPLKRPTAFPPPPAPYPEH